MKRRIVRGGAIALLIAVMAVTPMSAVLSSGHFDFVWHGGAFVSSVRVLLDDNTGLVREISRAPWPPGPYVAVANPGSNRRVLVVRVEGSSCDRSIHLVFARSGAGFVIHERTGEGGCSIGTGSGRAIAIYLWTPVDASTVTLKSE